MTTDIFVLYKSTDSSVRYVSPGRNQRLIHSKGTKRLIEGSKMTIESILSTRTLKDPLNDIIKVFNYILLNGRYVV